ncbi:MAG: hypothetical protein M1450_00820 [Patescibacteria group bacterium]|nr:hypothetical protein [Patescibacteria group bacterium]
MRKVKIKRVEEKKSKFFFKILIVFCFLCLIFSGVFAYIVLTRSLYLLPIPSSLSLKDITPQEILRNINRDSKEIESNLQKKNIPFSSVFSYGNDSFLVKLKNNEEIILSKNKDISFQVSSLQLMISRFTIEGKRIKRVDFRFDKPVVSFM